MCSYLGQKRDFTETIIGDRVHFLSILCAQTRRKLEGSSIVGSLFMFSGDIHQALHYSLASLIYNTSSLYSFTSFFPFHWVSEPSISNEDESKSYEETS